MQTKTSRFKISSLNDLASIRTFMEKSANDLGADKEAAADLIVAANEAVTNIFIHGFNRKPCDLEISISFIHAELTISIIDSGPAFDPTTVANPDIDATLEERRPGGLGVHMMYEFADTVSYIRTKNEKNQLLLKIGGPNGNKY